MFFLAVFAVLATTATMGGASSLMREASGNHYADDMLRHQLAQVRADHPAQHL